ncbi:MAG: hypothetical protein HYV03_08315, partial [Deltaproteobacteria bacterium]|nr:hypothetical protein [Deltaproteobacteria bacterium]
MAIPVVSGGNVLPAIQVSSDGLVEPLSAALEAQLRALPFGSEVADWATHVPGTKRRLAG